MYKSLVNVLFKSQHVKSVRTFLSESYKCTEQWNQRLNSPILQKVRLEELSYSLEQKYTRKEPISPIDVDVFVNSINDDGYLNELRDILHKFRTTKDTTFMLESTSYASIRHFIDNGKLDVLLEILDDRLNYGLFLDDFTGNMVLDEFIKQKDFSSAAKVASLFMLQEDFNNEITENLSLYACFKYFESLVAEEATSKPEELTKKKKEEEIKVRLRYLINPYFDDHFDLRDLKLLAGKTLSALTKQHSDIFSLNCQLIGWLFYKKTDKLNAVSQKIIKSGLLLEDTLKIVELSLQQNHIREDENMLSVCTQLLEDLQKVKINDKTSMEETIVKKINDSLNKHQEEHIHKHSRIFDEWEKVRENKFKEQLGVLEEKNREDEQIMREKKLRDIEEKLWFLENEEKVDMKIEENERILEEELKKLPKKGLKKDEEYIPPEITKQSREHFKGLYQRT